MAREGYLIMDSDLHMMEPDDLWARYLDEPHGNGGAGARDTGARLGAGSDRFHP